MEGTKAFFASRTVWGILVSVAALLLSKWGLSLGPEDQASAIDIVLNIVGGVSAIFALIGRVLATRKIG